MSYLYDDNDLARMDDGDLSMTLAQLEADRARVEAALARRSQQKVTEADARPVRFDPDSEHPHVRGTQRFYETIDSGGTTQEGLSAFLQETLGAAAAGDERVVVPEPRIGSAE